MCLGEDMIVRMNERRMQNASHRVGLAVIVVGIPGNVQLAAAAP